MNRPLASVQPPARSVSIVGGGIAGLVAAITCAEAGAQVVLHEARAELGGRARSSAGPWIANLGPHGLCSSRPYWRWLKQRNLLPETSWIGPVESRFHYDGRVRRLAPAAALRAVLAIRKSAPYDLAFGEWARSVLGERPAWVASRIAAATFAYHHDPARLAADFVWQRINWLLVPPAVHRVVGGWSVLVERMARRARALGVHIERDSRIEQIPPPPVIVALELRDAASLLGKELSWPSGRGVAFDLGLESRRGDAATILDLDEGALIQAQHPSASPPGHRLYQIHAGRRDDESADETQGRIERVLDHAFADWRARTAWKRRLIVEGRTGAVNHPGQTWRDRPAIVQGDGVFLAGDMVAADGVLSEVCYTSGQEAARLAVRWLREAR
jgi:phytoene dehydrogenase-like protein